MFDRINIIKMLWEKLSRYFWSSYNVLTSENNSYHDYLKRIEEKRALLPKWIRYPCAGDEYIAIEDFNVKYLTSYYAAYTGGGKGVLPKGEKVKVGFLYGEKIISNNIDDKPLSVCCGPIKYDELHSIIVDESERSAKTYSGYYFIIDTIDLNTEFLLCSKIE